jgi:DNA repair protein RecO (recombination protein O)
LLGVCMEIIDEAVILAIRRFGERGAIVTLFSARHGVLSGLVKQATSKAMRGVLQPGNQVAVRWHARLNDQLGILTLELTKPVAALLMADMRVLAGLNAACSLLATYVPEREENSLLYQEFQRLISFWLHGEGEEVVAEYVRFELALLTACGFGLDIEECALTGRNEGLAYVSPRSGRAVCAEAAIPYISKLLRLPAFLSVENSQKSALCRAQVIDGLHLSGYFLTRWLAESAGRPLPPARARFVAQMQSEEALAPQNQDTVWAHAPALV